MKKKDACRSMSPYFLVPGTYRPRRGCAGRLTLPRRLAEGCSKQRRTTASTWWRLRAIGTCYARPTRPWPPAPPSARRRVVCFSITVFYFHNYFQSEYYSAELPRSPCVPSPEELPVVPKRSHHCSRDRIRQPRSVVDRSLRRFEEPKSLPSLAIVRAPLPPTPPPPDPSQPIP
jgi:hypothetical protein